MTAACGLFSLSKRSCVPAYLRPSIKRGKFSASIMSFELTAPGGLGSSLIDDINGHIFPDIRDFYGKFFANRPWASKASEFVQRSWPHGHEQIDFQLMDNVTTWLQGIPADLARRAGLHGFWHTGHVKEWKSSGKLLVLSTSRKLHNWDDVEVLGFFHQGTHQQGILQLCCYAKSVFYSQPSRVFLHGFIVSGQKAQMWLFDRSGIYGSSQLTVTGPKDPFLTAMAGYMLMNSVELGMSPLVHRNEEVMFISSRPDMKSRIGRYILANKIFERVSGNLVGDGLTVYRARRAHSSDRNYAVKFKWSDDSERNELRMLNLLQERNVWGVIRLVDHHVGDSTKTLHDGLALGNPLTLQPERDGSHDEIDGDMEPSSQDVWDEPKRFICTVVTPQGRSLHNYQSIPEVLFTLRDAIRAHRSLYQDGRILHRDINPSNIIIPSYGPDTNATDAARGVLIDFDMAKENSEPYQPNQAVGTYIFQAIGVLQAYLPDNPHTYRHDLESFFYTLLFLAVAPRPVPDGENQLQLPPSSLLREWYKGRLVDKANRKIQDMESADEFKRRIVAEFTPEFQGLEALAEKLRAILFPMDEDGEILTGTDLTDHGTNALYDAVIGAFGDAALEHARL